jgi:hypothetical protein
VAELLQTLARLVVAPGPLVWQVVLLLAHWALLTAWVAWWLFAVNWRRTWARAPARRSCC